MRLVLMLLLVAMVGCVSPAEPVSRDVEQFRRSLGALIDYAEFVHKRCDDTTSKRQSDAYTSRLKDLFAAVNVPSEFEDDIVLKDMPLGTAVKATKDSAILRALAFANRNQARALNMPGGAADDVLAKDYEFFKTITEALGKYTQK